MSISMQILRRRLPAILLMVILIGAGGAAAQPATPNQATAIYLPLLAEPSPAVAPALGDGLFLTAANEYHLNSSIAIDSAGATHVAFTGSGSTADGVSPAYYSTCPTAASNTCREPADWQRVVLGNATGDVQLLLTPEGAPRVLISPEGNGRDAFAYRYAACDSICTNPANWTITAVGASNANNIDASRELAQSFVLDAQGRPRFVYVDFRSEHAGTFYAACDNDCTNPNAWEEVQIDPIQIDDIALQLDDNGLPHLLGGILNAEREAVLIYSSYDPARGWQAVTLAAEGAGDVHWTLQLHRGRPRVAFYQGVLPSGGDHLRYLACDSACAEIANWYAHDLGLGTGIGMYAALALDSRGHPRIAFAVGGGNGLGYAWCDNDCAVSEAVWQSSVLESPAEAIAELPPVPFCSDPVWSGGEMPALALDSAGNPRVLYEGELSGRCLVNPQDPNDGTTRVFTIFRGVRLLLAAQPGA